ncbi:MAG: molybdopterin molybdotransferase MoeA [Clostridiales Family XIII bacterium]|nr:molybdopterin molybdotransferase MoeA [Clostridiales Family XIII bacterium]
MMQKNIRPDAARELLAAQNAITHTEVVTLSEARGRVLASDFIAVIDNPPFDRSAFDGYALRSADITGASQENPVTLAIDEEIPAGRAPRFATESGHAAKILTGAPVPEGADAVIKFELTEYTDERVTVTGPLRSGENVIYAGEDFARGRVVLPAGSLITPAMLGVIASQGLDSTEVFTKPLATMVNVGSEIVRPGTPLPPAKIYNSSRYSLEGYIRELGMEFADGGVVPDDPERIAAAVRTAAACSDLVITTGGASTGDYDFAAATAELVGGNVLFWKVAMRPGGALLAYMLGETMVLSLSGSPGAAVLGLVHIAHPYIRKLCGRSDVWPEECLLRLAEAQTRKNPVTRILRGNLAIKSGEAVFVAEATQRGGDLASLIAADVLVLIPAGTPPLEAGALVQAFRI